MGASMGLRVQHLPSLSLPAFGIFSLCRVPGPGGVGGGGVGSGELYPNTLELTDLGCSSGSGATLPKPATSLLPPTSPSPTPTSQTWRPENGLWMCPLQLAACKWALYEWVHHRVWGVSMRTWAPGAHFVGHRPEPA